MCWVLISVQFSKSLVCCSGSVSCMLHSRLGLGCEQWFMLEYRFQSLTGAHFPSPFARNTEFLLGFCLSLLPWLLQLHYGGHSRQGYEKKKNPKTRISFCCSCFLLVLLGPYTLANARRGDRKKLHRKHLPMSHFFKILLFFTNLPAFAFFSESWSSCFMYFIRRF